MKLQAKNFGLQEFLSGDEKFHIARVNIASSRDLNYHTHDYAEILWVESGSGIHFVNDRQLPLKAGDIVMVRPSDRHMFRSKGKGLTIVNFAFSADTLAFLKQRYPDEAGYFFSNERTLPYMTSVSSGIITNLSSIAEASFSIEKNLVLQDSILLSIFRILGSAGFREDGKGLPQWLSKALAEFSSSAGAVGSANDFARYCGRNSDYINRLIKKSTGKTLAQTIQEKRMKYASTQLTITSMPIKQIALNCGYTNLGYFYKVFCKYLGTTPKQYRISTQRFV